MKIFGYELVKVEKTEEVENEVVSEESEVTEVKKMGILGKILVTVTGIGFIAALLAFFFGKKDQDEEEVYDDFDDEMNVTDLDYDDDKTEKSEENK